MSFAEATGGRISDVSGVKVSDIDLEKQQARIWISKTLTWHVVPFHAQAKRHLAESIAARGERGHDFLPVGPRGKPMTKATLRTQLNRVLCGPGKLASFSFHRLRGYAATTLAKSGSDVLSIAPTIGWRELSSAQKYIELDTADPHETYHRAMDQRVLKARERPVVQTLPISLTHLSRG